MKSLEMAGQLTFESGSAASVQKIKNKFQQGGWKGEFQNCWLWTGLDQENQMVTVRKSYNQGHGEYVSWFRLHVWVPLEFKFEWRAQVSFAFRFKVQLGFYFEFRGKIRVTLSVPFESKVQLRVPFECKFELRFDSRPPHVEGLGSASGSAL